jgi:hypothetical protein
MPSLDWHSAGWDNPNCWVVVRRSGTIAHEWIRIVSMDFHARIRVPRQDWPVEISKRMERDKVQISQAILLLAVCIFPNICLLSIQPSSRASGRQKNMDVARLYELHLCDHLNSHACSAGGYSDELQELELLSRWIECSWNFSNRFKHRFDCDLAIRFGTEKLVV